jgi:hypothetical protein
MQEMNAQGNINGEEGQGEEEEAVVGDRRAIVDARKGNKHAKGTKTSYLGKQLNFALFAQESYPGVLASPFRGLRRTLTKYQRRTTRLTYSRKAQSLA